MSAALQTATRFVVNVLAADQEHISRRFASEDPDRFDGIGYQENRHGIAVLDGVLASIECEKQAEAAGGDRSEEHTSELQSRLHLVCRLLLEKKKKTNVQETI